MISRTTANWTAIKNNRLNSGIAFCNNSERNGPGSAVRIAERVYLSGPMKRILFQNPAIMVQLRLLRYSPKGKYVFSITVARKNELFSFYCLKSLSNLETDSPELR